MKEIKTIKGVKSTIKEIVNRENKNANSWLSILVYVANYATKTDVEEIKEDIKASFSVSWAKKLNASIGVVFKYKFEVDGYYPSIDSILDEVRLINKFIKSKKLTKNDIALLKYSQLLKLAIEWDKMQNVPKKSNAANNDNKPSSSNRIFSNDGLKSLPSSDDIEIVLSNDLSAAKKAVEQSLINIATKLTAISDDASIASLKEAYDKLKEIEAML